ncbi:MAG: PAS domain S-box protein [Acidobacteriaceae bacterium]|nr:PAS domain S-box protein [Acidobacteriaceae bacterium]
MSRIPAQVDVGSSIEQMSTSELRARVAGLETLVQELTDQLAVYERVFNDNPIPSIVYSAEELSVLTANQSALELYGYAKDEMCSRKLTDLFASATLRNRPDLISELQKPRNAITRVTHQKVTGQELVVSLVSFTFEAKGKNARIMMVEDETARHNTEEALRTSEERFRELFENANDVIFLHDLKGKILEVNRAAEHLTGYSRVEVLGKGFEELIAPEARNVVLDIVRAHLGGSVPQHYELPVISKGGKLRFLEVSTRIIYRRGHPIAIQGIGRDITERKQAQQKLLESSRELQLKNEELSTALHLTREATRLKEQFLANTSHELRTPMNGIMGMINLLKATDLTADQSEYADAVSQCANDLLTIINDLLDLSQMEARRLSLADEPFDVYESVKSVVKLLSLRAGVKELTLTYEIEPGLPQYIYGDCVRFRQILTNLIANAVKFTPSGGVKIRLRADSGQNLTFCEVIDSGIGVEDSVQERIFEAFFQADGTTRRRFGGSGLGLTICKQLVENMGGRIGMYNNTPFPGATFWFELPLRPVSLSPAEIAEDFNWSELPGSTPDSGRARKPSNPIGG